MIIEKSASSRINEFDPSAPFGSVFTDHMLLCEYENGKWGEVRILPYGKLSFSPAMMAIHYGQACFEGMKAYKDKKGEVFIFRPEKNLERINKSAKRMAMPKITREMFIDGIKSLVDVDRDWVFPGEGNSLYLRPVLFATGETLRAEISNRYMFCILATPAKSYYTKPLSVLIAEHYSRAANGGVGFAKAAGNYGASFYPTKLAVEEGYGQVIWTDNSTHQYIEESGTMNVFVRIGDSLYTPPTSDRILDGVTRDSFIYLAKRRGIEVKEELIGVESLVEAHRRGDLKEMWGVGTAVLTSVFESIGYQGKKLNLPQLSEQESYAKILKKDLVDIQTNGAEDPFGWRVKVERISI